MEQRHWLDITIHFGFHQTLLLQGSYAIHYTPLLLLNRMCGAWLESELGFFLILISCCSDLIDSSVRTSACSFSEETNINLGAMPPLSLFFFPSSHSHSSLFFIFSSLHPLIDVLFLLLLLSLRFSSSFFILFLRRIISCIIDPSLFRLSIFPPSPFELVIFLLPL